MPVWDTFMVTLFFYDVIIKIIRLLERHNIFIDERLSVSYKCTNFHNIVRLDLDSSAVLSCVLELNHQ